MDLRRPFEFQSPNLTIQIIQIFLNIFEESYKDQSKLSNIELRTYQDHERDLENVHFRMLVIDLEPLYHCEPKYQNEFERQELE